MNMRMVNRLSGYFAAVDTDVETLHRTVLCNYLRSGFVQQLIDCPSLRFEQIEEGGDVTPRYD